MDLSDSSDFPAGNGQNRIKGASMEKIQLKTKKRDLKSNLKKLRAHGEVPAVLYGHNVKNVSLVITKTDFEKTLKKAGESSIIDLLTDGSKIHPVLIHDIQYHYLTNEPIHVDFYQVSMTEKLKAKVTLEFIGEAPAVKTHGGVLVKVLSDVEVQCLPADLPHNISVDISALVEFSSTIHVRDLKVTEKVQILTPDDETVAKVQPPRDIEAEIAKETVAAEAEKAAVEAVVAATEKPKVEDKEKEGEKAGVDEKGTDKPAKEEKK